MITVPELAADAWSEPDPLTERERQVMALVIEGVLNKQIGAELGLSEFTIKVHRGNLMRKLNARSVPDLKDTGASQDQVASQLMHTPRRGDAEAARVLQETGLAAFHRGAIDNAASYLKRALEEARRTFAQNTPGDRSLLSSTASAAVDSAFNSLAQTMLVNNARTIEDLVAALQRKAERTPTGQWVNGSRYQETKLGRQPTRFDLDRASTNHPIIISHSSGHQSVCNSLALSLARVDRNTPRHSSLDLCTHQQMSITHSDRIYFSLIGLSGGRPAVD